MKKEKKIIPVLVRLYHDFPFKRGTIKEGDKLFGGRRLSSIHIFEDTEKNRQLGSEHNTLLEEMEEIRRKMHALVEQMEKPLR